MHFLPSILKNTKRKKALSKFTKKDLEPTVIHQTLQFNLVSNVSHSFKLLPVKEEVHAYKSFRWSLLVGFKRLTFLNCAK